MQIVIDIDDNLYTRLFDNGVDNYDDTVDMVESIRKGTPLPKGHGRLIDADDLYENTEIYHSHIDGYDCVRWKDIKDAPTIIEADAESEGEK